MPRYRFLSDQVYKSGSSWPTYEGGKVYDLTTDFGERWVRRQVAVLDNGDGEALPDPRFHTPAPASAAEVVEVSETSTASVSVSARPVLRLKRPPPTETDAE